MKNSRMKKIIACYMMLLLSAEIVAPNVAFALTTGPSQPEVQSFEPVGTTDMVDMFTGDFTYNIPLLDVEGYPVNIAYHGGITMEQEASWVGLGWNINPGVINRTVRGIPDDFNGDVIKRQFHVKDEKTLRVGLAGGKEIVGRGDPDAKAKVKAYVNAGVNLTFNNYRGVSCDLSLGGGIKVGRCASAGVNIGVGSAPGQEIDYSANIQMSIPDKVSKTFANTGIGVGVGGGYNSIEGVKNLNYSGTFTLSNSRRHENGSITRFSSSITAVRNMPISMQNHIPAITNSSSMTSLFGRLKGGGELAWCFGYLNASAMQSILHYEEDGSRPAFGYLNAHRAGISAISDFTRDRDGLFNKTMAYLPLASMTYDVYGVSGQGTGGIFRPFRNDYVSVFDPATESKQNSRSIGLEAATGKIFELGFDKTKTETEIKSGPWLKYMREAYDTIPSKLYERTYFKDAGELTSSKSMSHGPMSPADAMELPFATSGSLTSRVARANVIVTNVGPNGGGKISQIIQTQKDGTRYVYGVAANNNIQNELTFSVDPPNPTDAAAGLVAYTPGVEDNIHNNKGIDNLYSSSITPGYAHSFFLSAVLPHDYVDVTGDGISDDDLGNYTKFGYQMRSGDYRWKAPFEKGKAQYNPGFWSESRDDKANLVIGSRQQWMLSSIETKNYVAEFYVSIREDGLGTKEKISDSAQFPYNDSLTTPGVSFKLDSILLFNKHDRKINAANAIAIKKVFFAYDYSLCPGVPNSTTPGGGKLTLKRIYFQYGNSQKGRLNPYQFRYKENPSYNLANKDRWGNYKPNGTDLSNYEYPYVNQNSPTDANTYAAAWSLTTIALPSGGIIEVAYEADDYAYVQDKQAGEMFLIKGIGNSPNFVSSSQLYADKKKPYLYAYFDRRLTSELSSMSFEANYLPDPSCMYFNFHVKLADKKNSYEQIKGYCEVESVGPCSDGVHGYIKMKPVEPKGGAGANLNPVTYTALNTGRYNLPQIVFPGGDPDLSDVKNILKGLGSSFESLVSMYKNPLVRLVNKGQGRDVKLKKSYVRLNSVGLRKKGGGQRVSQLAFSDSWPNLAGGNSHEAIYGKVYDYTINSASVGNISSGVASYEPLIGGDENPLRAPVKFSVSTGSKFPPNDPIDLYQELPIGENLYPPGQVGYRRVTVRSIHSDIGNSSQGVDIYQFYTAKDFPVQFSSTGINSKEERDFSFFRQSNKFEGRQGYSLVFNDMHGKPLSIEHKVYNRNSQTYRLISSQVYNYKQAGGQLSNSVPCLVYEAGSGMAVHNQTIGVETDITIDTREKTEETRSKTTNANLNVSNVGFLVIPIPFKFSWEGNYKNEFRSASVTKVTQQYGILDNIQTNNEGAITTLKNELFDPQSGNIIVTSVNNEYHDKEYNLEVPAWWTYTGMGTAYNNYYYETDVDTVKVDTNYIGRFVVNGMGNFQVGDEIEMDYMFNAASRHTKVWFLYSIEVPGACTGYTSPNQMPASGGGSTSICCRGHILPPFPRNTPGWSPGANLYKVHLKIVRPGPRNMLDQVALHCKMLENPINGSGQLKTSWSSLVDIKAATFSDTNTRIVRRYITNPDTINPYIIGERGLFRKLDDYSFVAPRNYTGTTARNAGLFSANSLFTYNLYDYYQCMNFPYRYYAFNEMHGPQWRSNQKATKWSPNGKEVESRDALGIYSTAVYGHNECLPVAVATNARHGEILGESFEDYNLLQPQTNLIQHRYSPFRNYFGTGSTIAPYYLLSLANPSGLNVAQVGHTGLRSLLTTTASPGYTDAYAVSVPLENNTSYPTNRYNLFFPYGVYGLTSKNEYQTFTLSAAKKFILSFWIKQLSPTANVTNYSLSANWGIKIGSTIYPVIRKSDIIDGWQQVEVAFSVPSSPSSAEILLPVNYYVDDIRVFPSDVNMKAFSYNPISEKLMATLDENNFATFYEYDQEGALVRVKKETEKGIVTISESQKGKPKL